MRGELVPALLRLAQPRVGRARAADRDRRADALAAGAAGRDAPRARAARSWSCATSTATPSAPLVFKTTSEPHVGRALLLPRLRRLGDERPGGLERDARTGSRSSRTSPSRRGRSGRRWSSCAPGDIGVVAKLREHAHERHALRRRATRSSSRASTSRSPTSPSPSRCETRGDEDKLSQRAAHAARGGPLLRRRVRRRARADDRARVRGAAPRGPARADEAEVQRERGD